MNFQAVNLNIANDKIIDIRLPSEWIETGILPNSKLITYEMIGGKINPMFLTLVEKNFAKNDKIVLICQTGSRTKRAMQFLKNNGFTNVSDISGGVYNYKRLGAKFVPYQPD